LTIPNSKVILSIAFLIPKKNALMAAVNVTTVLALHLIVADIPKALLNTRTTDVVDHLVDTLRVVKTIADVRLLASTTTAMIDRHLAELLGVLQQMAMVHLDLAMTIHMPTRVVLHHHVVAARTKLNPMQMVTDAPRTVQVRLLHDVVAPVALRTMEVMIDLVIDEVL
jgi:hypothetical protein